MRILCVADIHGHAEAFQHVLQSGDALGCTVVLAAGDLCFPGPKPLETWNLLLAAHAHCVQGIADRAISSVDVEELKAEDAQQAHRLLRVRETRAALGEVILRKLGRLPLTFRMTLEDGGELLLVHASPVSPWAAITHDMDDDEIEDLLGDETASIVVCAGEHVSFQRSIGERLVIGIGSVGECPTPGYAHAVLIETAVHGSDVKLLQIKLPDAALQPSGLDLGVS